MSLPGLPLMLVQLVGWCLLHFLWQGIVVGGLYGAVRPLLPRGNPRYAVALLTLLVLAACPPATAWYLLHAPAQPVDLGGMLVTGTGTATAGAAGVDAAAGQTFQAVLPWLVLAWACGVLCIGIRVIRQWCGLRRIVRDAEALPAWQARARRFADRLGLRRGVRILASVRIATPTLVGWVRPVVVLPLAMLARMPREQLDLVIAHEFAHLRRLDHFANLFQVVLETVLFYHPVVHWISRDARNERELCCDALALRATGGSRRDFVAALAGLEAFRIDHSNLALAASGGVLVERAWFIAGGTPPVARARARTRVVGPALAAGLAVIVLGAAWQHAREAARIQAVLAGNATWLAGRIGAAVDLGDLQLAPLDIGSGVRRLAPLALVPVPGPQAVPAAKPSAAAPVVAAPVAITPVRDLAMATPVAPVVARELSAAPSAAGAARNPPAAAVAPRVLQAVAPDYPPEALRAGAEGTVQIQFTLTPAGTPAGVRAVGGQRAHGFAAAAVRALAQWRFAPPAVAGRVYRQAFTFRLGAATGSATAGPHFCRPATGTHICRADGDDGPMPGVVPPGR